MSEQLEAPSELFWDAVVSGGSPVIDCGFCGRTHFATGDRSDADDKELAELRAKAAEKPDKYVEDASNDSVAWGYLGGCTAVWNCPCKQARKYENFIWSHRHMIARYVKARTEQLLKDVKRDEATAAALTPEAP